MVAHRRGEQISRGAATVLDMPPDSGKDLRSLTVRTIANEVVMKILFTFLAALSSLAMGAEPVKVDWLAKMLRQSRKG